jgi:hypothetical protein
MLTNSLAIAFFSICFMLLMSPKCLAAELTCWVVHGTTRVKPDAQPGNNKTAAIKAAKNEYEPFQVILRSQENLKNVDVTASDLVGADGQRIGKENITLFREHYVYVRVPSSRCENPPGWYPDALLPFADPVTGERIQGRDIRFIAAPFDIWGGINQAIWVDVFVPREATAGDYSGELTVIVGGNETLKVPVNLTVWDFVLPDIPSMQADFGGYGRAAKWHDVKADSEEFRQIETRYCEAMADHRICPEIPGHLHPKPNPDGSISTEETHAELKEFIETMRVNSFRIRFGTRHPYSDPLGEDRDKAIQYLRNVYGYLEANGWADMAYTYIIDEPNDAEAYDRVRAFAQLLHEAHPKLKFLCTEQTKTQDPDWGDFYGYVDVWVPLWPLHDEENAQERLDAGDELWSYTALCQGKEPSPFWQLDFPVLNYRIPMWGSWRYQMTGLLYWSVVFWERVKDPWLDQLTIYGRYNGDGSILYPGADAGIAGPVTSIRLKNIREGMEDYEYFKVLEDLGDREFVDKQVREMIQTWFSWETSPDRLMEVRERLAKRILELRK